MPGPVDGHAERRHRRLHDLPADYTDTYVRYRSGDTRLTLGAQTIIWGRVDEIPLADRVSRVDLTRFLLDDLPAVAAPQLAARWEQNFGEYKLDPYGCRCSGGTQLPDHQQCLEPDQPEHRRDHRHRSHPGRRGPGGRCATSAKTSTAAAAVGYA